MVSSQKKSLRFSTSGEKFEVTRSYWIPDVDEPQDESNLDLLMEEDHWLVATTVITEDLRWENSEDEIFEANLDAGGDDVDETCCFQCCDMVLGCFCVNM